MKKLLAVTVGTGREGQPARPIVVVIRRENPGHVVFFVTQESLEITLPKVLEQFEGKPFDYDECLCADENEVIECYKIFRRKLIELIENGITTPENIVVDFTTGTKAMSAALVMAGLSLQVDCLTYVSGKRKNGVVETGTEKVNPIRPVDIYWERIHHQVVDTFNAFRFTECLHLIDMMLAMTEESEKKEKAEFLRLLAESYLKWDLFDIESAHEGLKHCEKQGDILEYYGCKETITSNISFINSEMKSIEYTKDKTVSGLKRHSKTKAVDLYGNALRRLQEGKYDDAVARLYRLLEYMAQATLFNEFEIDTSSVDVSKIPIRCKNLVSKHDTSKKSSIGLSQGYELLNCLCHPLGRCIDDLKEILGSRNNSILAHGFTPVGENTATKMIRVIEPLLEIFLEKPLKKYAGWEFPKLEKH